MRELRLIEIDNGWLVQLVGDEDAATLAVTAEEDTMEVAWHKAIANATMLAGFAVVKTKRNKGGK